MAQSKQCTVEGCDGRYLARGMCKAHYRKWERAQRTPAQVEKDNQYDRDRRATPKRQESERQRNRRRLEYLYIWQQRRAMPQWAAKWEAHRLAEDIAEIATAAAAVVVGGPCCRLSTRPRVGNYVAGTCPDCGIPVVVEYRRWSRSIRCPPCTRARWRETHYERAKRYGVTFDVVKHEAIFERDGWRCQICGKPTKGKSPDPMSPSLDHIVPMARGGHHVKENLQTAHLRCNVRKGARSANDQLRLAV